ncbi:MAG: phosphosulfolactate synthase [Actinomycetota bacterium]|jgi:phosphosulfolactate synthase|nr:phosphosulfolactate synthase [Actinomycetota bacterium]
MSISSTVNGFLDLPVRAAKPREVGITHVMDKGLSPAQIEGLMATGGEYVDIVKLGWGTSYVTQNLREKLALYRSLGVPVVCGGTLLEIAEVRGKLDGYRSWLSDNGFESVEVSDGTIDLPRERKLEIIETLAQDFRVLSEVGSKDAEAIFAPYQWVEWIREELGAGAWKVITEARESGTAGIFRGSGEVRSGLIDEIVHELPVERLLFEAPQKSQQAWFIRQFGPEVNLGNIPPDEIIPLETLRLGLRSDTMSALLLDVKA